MKIYYIFNARFPTERAHGIQVANTCASFSRENIDITLIVPKRKNILNVDLYKYYNVDKAFTVEYLPSIDFVRSGKFVGPILFWVQSISFLFSLLFRLRKEFKRPDIVLYGRDEILLAPLLLFTRKIYWETHMGTTNIFAKLLVMYSRGLICISKGLEDFYKVNYKNLKSIVAPDAVKLDIYNEIDNDKISLRKELGLPTNNTIITYCGSLGLYTWKGVDIFLESLRINSNINIKYMIVGGSKDEIFRLSQKYSDDRIIFVGQVVYNQISKYLIASDVLVLPNKSGTLLSEKFTSPMKLFEYMASGRPIIASDLPSIREVLDDGSAYFFKANDYRDLSLKIQMVLNDYDAAQNKGDKAKDMVREFSWQGRAYNIINFINHENK